MKSFTLNDGSFIYDGYSLEEKMQEIGFDIDELQAYFFEKECRDQHLDFEALKANERSLELESDHYFGHLRDLAIRLTDIVDKMIAGEDRRQKKTIGKEIKELVEYYRCD